jgi:tripartite-type tricarboxylate transporter receptor subunit TctC
MSKKYITKAVLSALLLTAAALSQAQTYPDKPVKMLVGFAAGGATDLVTRTVAQYMSEALGQPILVENRTGASGLIATEALAKAPADGYTLLACSTAAFSTLPFLMKPLRFDPVKDIAPIAQIGTVPYVLVANTDLKVNTVQDVIQLAKQRAAGVTYASGGTGSSSHLAGELFASVAGVTMTHVAYKGLAAAMADLTSGRIDFAFDQEASAGSNIRSGKLVPIAIASARRSKSLPDVPTFAEKGVALEAAQWIGVCAPSGTPKPVIDKIRASLSSAMQKTQVKERFFQLGAEPTLTTPAEFKAYIAADRQKWEALIDKAKIRLD